MSDFLKLGLLGHPLSHALSPILQNAALQYAGIKGEYSLFDIKPEFIETGVKEMLDSGVIGFNITIPYKQTIYKMTSNLTEDAKRAGAVNTVKVGMTGKLSGHNTDVIGFKLALAESFNYPRFGPGNTALIIGAGGSARAVAVALGQLGFGQVKIKARNQEKALSFISEMKANLDDIAMKLSLWDERKDKFANVDLVINASPIGLNNEESPDWLEQIIEQLNPKCFCFDLVYGRNGNLPAFAKLASDKGLKAIDGLPMLIQQARYAFDFWTGIIVPAQVMYAALNNP